jgi:hypothetical protein
MARNRIGGRGSGGRLPASTRLPAQFGAGAKVTAPTSGYSGNYPSRGPTAPHNRGTKATGRYPA